MPRELDHILIKGACEHNLQSVDIKIPKKKLVVFTGVSGSGKSSLAFDTLYAEGQRRYVESLSAYARQFLDKLDKPKYDTIRGLSPTIAIEQKTASSNPRSTVGTITELADYLRVLFARVGVQHCHRCGNRVKGQSAQQIATELLDRASKHGSDAQVLLFAALLVNRKGEHRDMLDKARQDGWVRLRIDGEIVRSDAVEALDKRRKHTVHAVVDRIRVTRNARQRLTESVEAALRCGEGVMSATINDGEEQLFSEMMACNGCGLSFPPLTPQSFSFNSPQGMCGDCNGLGMKMAIDPELVVPNRKVSLDDGALAPWGTDVSSKTNWAHGFRGQFVKQLGISPKVPWNKLPAKARKQLLFGTGERTFQLKWKGKTGSGKFEMPWEGLIPRLTRRFQDTRSERAKRWYSQYMGQTSCHTCGGSRMRRESAAVLIDRHSLVEVSAMTVDQARTFFHDVQLTGAAREIAAEVLKEIRNRLEFLSSVGLGYLSLDRSGPTLSGGESQRIRLASQVGSDLTGVIYVLDEPSIGLHQRDNQRLLKTLERMRDIGNTVVVVEHDEDTIRKADHVVDFGPGAGVRGGRLVFSGHPKQLLQSKRSITGDYLAGRKRIEVPQERRDWGEAIVIRGATENNLRDVTATFPVGVLTAVTGVSGAGKSTLVNDILWPALSRRLHQSSRRIGRHDSIEGIDHFDKIVAIDQKPIGRTPRSNPATYIKVFDEIRHFFAKLPEARAHAYPAGRFSFNVKGGRCESCQGDGVRRIEMHFLSAVYVRCEECQGKRFNEATLQVRYKGHSIADVLALTVSEALALFEAHPKVARPLRLLEEVGVDYLHLGQSSPTLSGGEAQRIKLARELSKRATGRTLYLLDEPTTGLHFDDVRKLLAVLHRLADAGNTVIVIEHNLDVIKTADHIVDLGPEGGPDGGQIIAQGTPEEITRVAGSHTGKFLTQVLPKRRGKAKKKPNNAPPLATSPRTAAGKRAAGKKKATSKRAAGKKKATIADKGAGTKKVGAAKKKTTSKRKVSTTQSAAAKKKTTASKRRASANKSKSQKTSNGAGKKPSAKKSSTRKAAVKRARP